MTDIVDPLTRSKMMARIKAKDTKPEVLVRRYLHATGLRFRLHSRLLPGTPDLVFPRYRAAVFVNGCFWHRHDGCRYATLPATRPDFWAAKFDSNVRRDHLREHELRSLGWRPITFWECETRNVEKLDRLFWLIVSGA